MLVTWLLLIKNQSAGSKDQTLSPSKTHNNAGQELSLSINIDVKTISYILYAMYGNCCLYFKLHAHSDLLVLIYTVE